MFCKQPTELESSKKENGENGSYRGVMYASCLDIVMNFIVLVSYLLEDSIRLRMHLFAQVYVTELQAEKFVEKLSILPVLHGQQFIFHHLRCCMRYHGALGIAGEIADVQSFDDWNRSSQSFYGQIFTSPCSILTLDGDRSIHGLQKRFRWPGRQICALFFLYFCVGRFSRVIFLQIYARS